MRCFPRLVSLIADERVHPSFVVEKKFCAREPSSRPENHSKQRYEEARYKKNVNLYAQNRVSLIIQLDRIRTVHDRKIKMEISGHGEEEWLTQIRRTSRWRWKIIQSLATLTAFPIFLVLTT